MKSKKHSHKDFEIEVDSTPLTDAEKTAISAYIQKLKSKKTRTKKRLAA